MNRKTGEFEYSFAPPNTPLPAPVAVIREASSTVNRKTGEFEFSKPDDSSPPSTPKSASPDSASSDRTTSTVNRKTGEFEFSQERAESVSRPTSRDSASIAVNRKTGEFEVASDTAAAAVARPRLLSIDSMIKRRFSRSGTTPPDSKPSLFLSSINKLRRIPSHSTLFKPKREAC